MVFEVRYEQKLYLISLGETKWNENKSFLLSGLVAIKARQKIFMFPDFRPGENIRRYFYPHPGFFFFGPPRSGIGTYEFTLIRPFVRPSVGYFQISESFHRFVLVSCTKLQHNKRTEVTFSEFHKNHVFAILGQKLSKIAYFGLKNVHFDQFLQIRLQDFANFSYRNYIYVLILELSSECSGENLF